MKIFFIVILLFLCVSIYGQTKYQYFERWESDKTKVGSQVLDIYQDETGYIWLCTFNGLIRFDGQEFILAEKIYPELSKIQTQHISTIAQDNNGNIWIGTIEQGVFRLTQNGRVNHINDLCLKLNDIDQRPHKIIPINNELYILGRLGLTHFKLNEQIGKIEQLTDTIQHPHIREGLVFNGHLILATNDKVYSHSLPKMNKFELRKPYLFLHPNGELWMANREQEDIKLYHFLEKKWVLADHQPFTEIQGQYHFNWDNQNRLWAFKKRHHVLCYDFNELRWNISLENDHNNLVNSNIRDVVTDNSGTVWIGSEEVYLIKNHPKLSSYKYKNLPIGDISDFLHNGDTTIIAKRNGELSIYKDDKQLRFIKKNENGFYPGSIGSMSLLGNNLIGISQIGGFQLRNSNLDLIKWIPAKGSCRSILKIDSIIWGGAPNNLIKYNQTTNEISKYPLPRPKRGEVRYVNAMCKKSETEIYLGINHQPPLVYNILKDSFYQAPTSATNENERPNNINHMSRSSSGLISIATGKGLYMYNGEKYTTIFQHGYFKSTAWLSDNILTATDNASIYLYDLEKRESHHITQQHGLLNNRFEMRSSSSMDSKICFGGDEGLDCVSTLTDTISHKPILWVESLTVNHETHFLTNNIPKSLKSNTNHIDISINQMYTRDNSGASIFYRVSGESWNPVSHNHVTFENPKSGNYKIEFKSKIENLEVNSPIQTLSFSIDKPFYLKLWFWLISLFFSSLIISKLINKNAFKRKEKEIAESKLRADISELRLKSLSSQMNPHFTFNALNSMQQMISEGDTKGATKYIQKFSAMLRFVLEYADETWVTMAEELDFIETYLDMEQMRFNHSFQYKLNVEESILAKGISIPPFFIQPQLENAIKHGIRPLDHGGRVSLSITQNENQIKINIEDNGVGRTVSKKANLQTSTHKGISLIDRRIALLNRKSKIAEFKIIDLTDKKGNARGTLTTTILPFKIKS